VEHNIYELSEKRVHLFDIPQSTRNEGNIMSRRQQEPVRLRSSRTTPYCVTIVLAALWLVVVACVGSTPSVCAFSGAHPNRARPSNIHGVTSRISSSNGPTTPAARRSQPLHTMTAAASAVPTSDPADQPFNPGPSEFSFHM
jgi:hypothetical protein